MSTTRLLLATLLLILAWSQAPRAWAADYFVDTAHPQAQDGNPGRKDLPFKTISAALVQAGPGDTVFIAPGTYREEIRFSRPGSTGRPLALKALKSGEVQIKGSDVVRGWVRHAGAVFKHHDWAVPSQQVFMDGKPLQQIGEGCPFAKQQYEGKALLPAVGRGLGDLKEGSFFYDPAGKILYVWLPRGADPNGHLMEAAVRNWIIPLTDGPGFGFIELHNLNFSHGNQTAQGLNMGLVNVAGKNWLVSGCSFTHGDFSGLHVVGDGHRLLKNSCNYNGAVGINLNGSDAAHQWQRYPQRPSQNLLLEGNETNGNNYRRFNPDWHAGGLRAATSCTGVVVTQHRALANDAPGIWFDGWCRDIWINRCTVKDNQGAGIFYEISDKAVISNNLVLGSKHQGIYVAASDEVKVINNTLDRNWSGIVLHGMPRADHQSLSHNEVKNNLLGDNAWADLVVYVSPNSAKGNVIDYNLYFRPDGKVRISWTGSPSYSLNYQSLPAFSQATGQEVHASCANPAWVAVAAANYALQPGSPAIDAGSNAAAGSVGGLDWAGKKRIMPGPGKRQAVIDIGAFEYQ